MSFLSGRAVSKENPFEESLLMIGKWVLRTIATLGLLLGSWTLSEAASPWEILTSPSVGADPDKTYSVTEDNGPWMIVAYTFSGDDARAKAKELALELRQRYKIHAYTYEGRFDLGEATGRGVDKYGNPSKWKYLKQDSRRVELKEVAVLVGDFGSAEDPEAQKIRAKLRCAQPQCLETKEDDKKATETLTGWRRLQNQVYSAVGANKNNSGPMNHAFMAPNPLLPPEYFNQRNGLDPEAIALNEGVPYSLLDCPGKYTVQVATFKGKVIIKQDEIKEIQDGNKPMDSELAKAAEKADRLTKALREKGYEAYQFHDCSASIVTVGSFNSVGSPRPDGKTEINPAIHQIIKVFQAQTITLPGQATPQTRLQTLVGIPFDVQPMPVQAPKRSISMAMRQRKE
jgi:hypothetical protein